MAVSVYPFAALFFPLLVVVTTLVMTLGERRPAIGLILLCTVVLVYRTAFFHYEEIEVYSDLRFEYLRRIELGQLPIVDYPSPVPWFEAQPLSYLSLHYLSSLAQLPPPLAAKLLRTLLGLTNLLFVFLLAYALTRSRRVALLAAALFVTSFVEFWDSMATQFKQGTGQAFWYAFLALFFLALSGGSLGRWPTAFPLGLCLVGATLGHKLFLFTAPVLLIPPALGTRYLGRRAGRFLWVLFLLLLAFVLPPILYLMGTLVDRWPWAASLRESAIFAGLRTPERLTKIGPFGWLGQLLALASGVVTLTTMLAAQPVSASSRTAWYLAGGMAMVGVSFSALYFFGLPVDGGRALQLIWPLVCTFLALTLHMAARRASQHLQDRRLFAVGLLLVLPVWALANLWNVMVDPETHSIELALRTPLPELWPLIYGTVFRERGPLIEAVTMVVALAVVTFVGAPVARALGARYDSDQDRLVRQVLWWSAPLWGLLFLTMGGTISLTAVRAGVIDRSLALALGVVLGEILSLLSGAFLRRSTVVGRKSSSPRNSMQPRRGFGPSVVARGAKTRRHTRGTG